jgi:hypothetical protein
MAPFQNSGSSDLSILIKKVFLPEVEETKGEGKVADLFLQSLEK